jgi:glycosyltransferase involved in cell wall biosynthesis
LKPYLGSNTTVQTVASPTHRRLRRALRSALPGAARLWRRFADSGTIAVPVKLPRSDGAVERLGIDVMHFTLQEAFLTTVPSLYHPHDLQHIHLPHYFGAADIAKREHYYRAFSSQAARVIAASSWTKKDFARHLGLAEEKLHVVPLAPPTERYDAAEVDAARRQLEARCSLPNAFIFYPAATWPHKNHLKLLEALAILRDRYGAVISLVASGHCTNNFYPTVQNRIKELGLDNQVSFIGFVTPAELLLLYQLSTLTVIPTKFEAGSFPMWEAFLAGSPVAGSNVTSLPDQAGDAALIFDPDLTEDIADKIHRLWMNPTLRQELVARGKARVAQFTWERTARHFRALYREVAGRPLSEADRVLLSASPLM